MFLPERDKSAVLDLWWNFMTCLVRSQACLTLSEQWFFLSCMAGGCQAEREGIAVQLWRLQGASCAMI